jgi:hypothetical protein
LPGGWKQTLPDFESHFDEVGYIEDASDEQFEAFEEE